MLDQAGVVLSPGAIYGPAGEGWFRISLTTPDERLLEAVERLASSPEPAQSRLGQGSKLKLRWSKSSVRDSAPSVSPRCRRGSDLAELGELLRTAGVAVAGEMVQQREQPHPNTYLGPGKVIEARAAAVAADANLIACDDELTARQERNLEDALGLPVVDRTTVILNIFAAHAAAPRASFR